MCTTMMVLCTIALVLRQKFSNKIKPMGLVHITHARRHSSFSNCTTKRKQNLI
uniref:Uncharacterized protein n=1 Tax=Gadus morhua TaxID=8049 RepID=A0A8C5FEA3_GADMO